MLKIFEVKFQGGVRELYFFQFAAVWKPTQVHTFWKFLGSEKPLRILFTIQITIFKDHTFKVVNSLIHYLPHILDFYKYCTAVCIVLFTSAYQKQKQEPTAEFWH